MLSDDIEALRAVALLAARRIDALRVTDERYNQKLREQEFSKLATEAQLSALRAQINPHFLFNALNNHRLFNSNRAGKSLCRR
ncbi:MAG: histidine kinase [Pyrinomonadaceae bacterium]